MTRKEANEDRKERFKSMSSNERKVLIRKKMEAEGLQEGSGVQGKNLSSYDRDNIWDLIQVTSCLSKMQIKQSRIQTKSSNKRKSVIAWILVAITFGGGIVVYYEQHPSQGKRKELSVLEEINKSFSDLIQTSQSKELKHGFSISAPKSSSKYISRVYFNSHKIN